VPARKGASAQNVDDQRKGGEPTQKGLLNLSGKKQERKEEKQKKTVGRMTLKSGKKKFAGEEKPREKRDSGDNYPGKKFKIPRPTEVGTFPHKNQNEVAEGSAKEGQSRHHRWGAKLKVPKPQGKTRIHCNKRRSTSTREEHEKTERKKKSCFFEVSQGKAQNLKREV